jgi:hypothetical protein
MLSHVSLSKVFLAKALLIDNYLQNRSPTKHVTNNMTVYGMWCGCKSFCHTFKKLLQGLCFNPQK